MKVLSALAAGLAGAVGLTLIHETVRRINEDAPRMDLLGMNALAWGLTKAGAKVPDEDKLFSLTMAGDIVSNALYYSLIGDGNDKTIWYKGASLGLLAGVGAVYLPAKMGLNDEPSRRTPQTAAMTIALYLAGGLIASATASALSASAKAG